MRSATKDRNVLSRERGMEPHNGTEKGQCTMHNGQGRVDLIDFL